MLPQCGLVVLAFLGEWSHLDVLVQIWASYSAKQANLSKNYTRKYLTIIFFWPGKLFIARNCSEIYQIVILRGVAKDALVDGAHCGLVCKYCEVVYGEYWIRSRCALTLHLWHFCLTLGVSFLDRLKVTQPLLSNFEYIYDNESQAAPRGASLSLRKIRE